MNLDDTIVAVATPPGRGGIGVVRIAGPEARAAARSMLRLPRPLAAGHAIFGELIDTATGERIDEVVATYFAAPHSYTTDDIVEISAHGSPVVLRYILDAALARGARMAEPGEFTLRAFLRGRLDLTQAEAVRDLIDSQTLYQAKVAAQQLEGAVSHRISPIKAKLVELITRMEAGVDFAEDDVPVIPPSDIAVGIAEVERPLRGVAGSFDYGRMVHAGVTLAIVGRPNVGKSSLFNRLVERERAIVTAAPGTTRDVVSETVAIGGIPVTLLDTAGLRHATNEAESIGIRKSREALADADLVLVVLDATAPIAAEDREVLAAVEGRNPVVVANKSDLAPRTAAFDALAAITTSAVTGAGIPELQAELLRRLRGGEAAQEPGFLTNARQQAAVESALQALAAAAHSNAAGVPHEMILLDLYNALRSLDELTGATTADDILNGIFGTFCIGK